jgi:hypothetical protein
LAHGVFGSEGGKIEGGDRKAAGARPELIRYFIKMPVQQPFLTI